ncbi:hypothetical protein DY000_02015728 [Brassica cretica]|uniref:DUF295 domain-containing protein n=1 Tax=Brassica cretica TaxID=69181 RepID=A0ABQ7D782_BRACR|nr:hypothetical protein DY000_02015728 [Brassica cretica]
MDFKLGRATSFPASLDCPDRVLALSAGHAEAPNKHLFLVGPVRHIRQQIEIVSPTDLPLCRHSSHQFSFRSSYPPYRSSSVPRVYQVISTEVHVFHHTDQTDRTLYWTVPHASGWELWLEPWPDDRFHRTEFGIHRSVSHFMKNSRDGNTFGHTNLEIDDRIFRTESRLSRPVLHSKKNGRGRFQFDRMDFKLGRATSFPASLDCPDRVLALSTGHAEAPNEHLFLVGPVRHIRQQIEIVSPTDLYLYLSRKIWCVQTLQPNKKLGERGRDQDLSEEEYKKC